MSEIAEIVSELGLPPIVTQIIGFVTVLILWNVKLGPYIEKLKYKGRLIKQSNTDTFIKDELIIHRDLILCDRIAIYEFHNSNHNLCGKSFLKYTCTYESCRTGVPGYNIVRKDIPISTHREVLNLIRTNNEVVSYVNNEENSTEFEQYLKDGNIDCSMLVPIINRGLLIGFMTIEFLNQNIRFSKDKIDNILNTAYMLVGKISHKLEKI